MRYLDSTISMDMIGFLSHNMLACKDNLILDDPETAAKELVRFKALGGKTIVEMTNQGISPKPLALREISTKLGLNIIAGCGHYVAQTHPPDVANKSVDQLAEEIIGDIQLGIDGTDVRPGIIGEIGTSHPLFESEKKVLRAAARAHRSTGLAVSVHMAWEGKHGLEVLDILESERMDPARVIIDHMDDMEDMSFEYQKAIAERGAYVEI
jgi:phosphotriesterase-related protein